MRVTLSYGAAAAVAYFEESSSKGDYYVGKEHSPGVWQGKAAERLGLSGEVKKEDFEALCYNRKPDGSKLNPRENQHRRVAYDVCFSSPKSASILWALTKDERIEEAFRKAVRETMLEIEREGIHVQQGQGKEKRLIPTGNLAWCEFFHKTSRPMEGVSDPHMHMHCFAFNTSWHEEKQRFQSGEFSHIKRQAPYYEAAFDARFSHYLARDCGVEIERRGLSWEVAGIDEMIGKFSNRTAQIEKEIARLEAEKGKLSGKEKAEIGARTRQAKTKDAHDWNELVKIWRGRLDEEETRRLDRAALQGFGRQPVITAKEALDRAEAHLFERKSVVQEYQLKREALRRGFGCLRPEAIEAEMGRRDYIRQKKGPLHLVTTQKALEEENRLLHHVRSGKGVAPALNAEYETKNEILSQEQKAAVRHVLESRDQIMMVAGFAGTGKTTLMTEIYGGVREAGKEIYGFAPSSAAAEVMRKEGLGQTETVAQLLHNPKLQKQMQNAVIHVDEAGMLGTRQMNSLVELANRKGARLLLSGDSRQLPSIERGDAMRLMEKEGGLKVARVKRIQRQNSNLRYKQVVELAARGKIDKALFLLEKQGGLIQIAQSDLRLQRLVGDVAASEKLGKKCLVIAPTHMEGRDVTQALREERKNRQLLGRNERSFTRLRPLHWTQENREDAVNYQHHPRPLVVEFHQNARGFRKGERWQVVKGSSRTLWMQKGEEVKAIPLEQAARFGVYEEQELKLAVGDRIRMTKESKTLKGTRCLNGQKYEITGFTRAGHIKLHTGKKLDKAVGHISYGYLDTAYSAQGKTVDHVFIAQSEASYGASNKAQLYVSLSRGRQRAYIYTDDKQALEEAVKQDGRRLSARELAKLQERLREQEWSRKKESRNLEARSRESGTRGREMGR